MEEMKLVIEVGPLLYEVLKFVVFVWAVSMALVVVSGLLKIITG